MPDNALRLALTRANSLTRLSRDEFSTRALFSTLLMTTTIVATTPDAAAATAIEEIVVTADYRRAFEMNVPEGISIVSADVIEARGAQHLEDIVGSVPNLNFAGGTGRARFFQIRGIGERSQFTQPVNPSVGVLVDQVDYSGLGSGATLLDVEQVEVLRGPQGTRYGANALAGLIRIKTFDPTRTPEAKFTVSGGNYGQREVSGLVSGALSSAVSGRVAIRQFDADGYTYNAFLDRNDVNYRDETTLRAKLAFEPQSGHRTLVTISHVDIDNGYDAFSLDNTRTTLSDEPGQDRQQTTAASIDSTFALGALDLQVIGAASRSDLTYQYDEDWTFVGIHPDGYSSKDAYFRQRDAHSLEARLLSDNSGGMQWVAGLYLLDSDEDLRREYTFLTTPLTSRYRFTSNAAFLQADLPVSERLTLSSGLRIEQRKTDYDDSDGVSFSPTDNMWGGQVSLQYAMTPAAMMYSSLSRGYKAGGFNTDGDLDADLRSFDPEYLWELEIGVKARLADNTLRLRGAVFYDLRRDQQVKSSLVRPRADGSTEFIDFLGNAAEGTNRGVELQADWQATSSLSLFANIGILDTRFDRYINEFGEDLSGRDQAQAPSWTANLGADLRWNSFFARIAVEGKDAFYFSDRHDLQSGAYGLINLRAGFTGDGWRVSAWSRNLNDRDYFIRGFGSFGNDPRKGYIVEPYKQFGEPKVFGVTLDLILQ